MDEQTEMNPHFPMINEQAPDFTAQTTHGEITLSKITSEGKWVVLFSHPSDFTPVCTTEFVAFSQIYNEFVKRNVQLIGLSIDSIYSHLGWIRSIEQNFKIKVPFPVIADLSMKVANLYGMVHPGASTTAAVRAVFFIDPKRNVRAILYYPLTSGRNMEEIIRLIDSLQIVDKAGVATPANWKPGEKVIIPAPTDVKAMELRLQMGECKEIEMIDWYLSKKSV